MSEIRRSGMKKRIENEMKERGEEGEVDIDSIDWLTGSYKLKSDVDGQTEEEDIPVITGKTSEDEEGIFSISIYTMHIYLSCTRQSNCIDWIIFFAIYSHC
jgi:hypothetical protein